jgi:uncharacterized protein with HEPN domain
MRQTDEIRLRHMLDAAQEALAFANGRSRTDLDSDRMLVLALVKSIEIIGEAATKVSSEARSAIASLPWPNIIGMRNRLIHAYFDIDLDRVWDTIVDDLPPLIAELKRHFGDT